MTKYQNKLSKEAKKIRNKTKLPWSACKWSAKKKQLRLKVVY